jgi:hypothetical protein
VVVVWVEVIVVEGDVIVFVTVDVTGMLVVSVVVVFEVVNDVVKLVE